jgi:O-antigen/teichoic acid export membrane protein
MKNDGGLILIGRISQAFLNIIALRVLTSILSPAQVGGFYLILALAGGFGLFLINPVQMYINRKLHLWHSKKSVLKHFFIFNAYILLISVISLIIVFYLKEIFGIGAMFSTSQFIMAVGLYIFVSNWSMTALPTLNMLNFRKSFVLLSVLTSVLSLIFSAAIVFFISQSAFSWISGQILGMGIMAIIAILVLKKKTREKMSGFLFFKNEINKNNFAALMKFAVPLSGATFFIWLQTQSYRIVVEKMISADFLGFLAVGLGIAGSLAAVTESLVQQLYFPEFYKKISVGKFIDRKNALAELSEKTIPVYLILTFFVVSLSSQLTGLLVDSKFKGVAIFVMFGAVIELLRMIGNTISAGAHSEMKTHILIKPYAIGGITTIVSVYLACKFFQTDIFIPGAMIIGGLATLWSVRREINKIVELNLKNMIFRKTILLSSVFLLFLFFHKLATPLWSFFILFFAGVYFVFLQYLVAFKWKKVNSESVEVVFKNTDNKYLKWFSSLVGYKNENY